MWQVSFENLQSSPQYVLKGKAETINNGLQAIEKMLEQKSENVAKAKEVQKVILPFFWGGGGGGHWKIFGCFYKAVFIRSVKLPPFTLCL